jgi:hypothetical protein
LQTSTPIPLSNTPQNPRKALPGNFGKPEVLGMFTEMVAWLGEQQVADEADPQFRSIFFRTEDRYCNRDTACAAAAPRASPAQSPRRFVVLDKLRPFFQDGAG